MTATERRWAGAGVWLLALLALAGVILASANLRSLLAEAIAQVTVLSVLATLPAQLAAALLCAGALLALRPGVGYWACLGSRLLRDAGGNLPIFVPGFGEMIGARALVLAGGGTRAAISASALDKLAETAAQVPFILLAVIVLWREWRGFSGFPVGTAEVLLLALALMIALAMAWRRYGRGSRFARRALIEWRKLLRQARHQRAGLPASIVLHVLAWATGGLQIWMAAWALGFDVTLFEAVAIESAAYAGRAIFFFIPAGLVSQEAGLMAAGIVFGLTAPEALALGLVLRLRDMVLASGLAIWPVLEWRRRKSG